jgi:lipopolysaccharide/colanic/teichoic acid biosynthesis glycosyltransferase
MQRFLDIFFSGIAIIIIIPIISPIACILRFTGEGEIFYRQTRVGRNGKSFDLIKFATMLKNSPDIGSCEITIKDDPRVLPFGKYLRKFKINELPQLWNIFIGDMSIVGPRPMVPKTYARYPIEAQKALNTIRPGLTGIGSIIFRDEERLLDGHMSPIKFYNENIMPHKCNLELWYVDNNTIWIYIKIIFVTACVVVFPSSNIAYKTFDGIPSLPKNLICLRQF